MVDNILLNNLYRDMIPVLQTKISKMKLLGYDYIKEKDVWNYFVNEVWLNNVIDKTIIIDDILNTPDYLIIDYILKCRSN